MIDFSLPDRDRPGFVRQCMAAFAPEGVDGIITVWSEKTLMRQPACEPRVNFNRLLTLSSRLSPADEKGSNSQGSSSSVLIGAGIGGAALLLAVLFALGRRRKKRVFTNMGFGVELAAARELLAARCSSLALFDHHFHMQAQFTSCPLKRIQTCGHGVFGPVVTSSVKDNDQTRDLKVLYKDKTLTELNGLRADMVFVAMGLLTTSLAIQHQGFAGLHQIYVVEPRVAMSVYGSRRNVLQHVLQNPSIHDKSRVGYIKDIASALSFLESIGMVHGAVCAEHFMVMDDDTIKVCGMEYAFAKPSNIMQASNLLDAENGDVMIGMYANPMVSQGSQQREWPSAEESKAALDKRDPSADQMSRFYSRDVLDNNTFSSCGDVYAFGHFLCELGCMRLLYGDQLEEAQKRIDEEKLLPLDLTKVIDLCLASSGDEQMISFSEIYQATYVIHLELRGAAVDLSEDTSISGLKHGLHNIKYNGQRVLAHVSESNPDAVTLARLVYEYDDVRHLCTPLAYDLSSPSRTVTICPLMDHVILSSGEDVEELILAIVGCIEDLACQGLGFHGLTRQSLRVQKNADKTPTVVAVDFSCSEAAPVESMLELVALCKEALEVATGELTAAEHMVGQMEDWCSNHHMCSIADLNQLTSVLQSLRSKHSSSASSPALAMSDLMFIRLLGEGQYGVVSLYEWTQKQQLVAVKTTKSKAKLEDLKAELNMMKSIRHVNLLGLICEVNASSPGIVVEYLSAGGLDGWLRLQDKRTPALDEVLLSILFQVMIHVHVAD